MLLWTVSLKPSEIPRLIEGDIKLVGALISKFRKLAGWCCLENLPKLTGIIEIDESNFFKRKIVGKAFTKDGFLAFTTAEADLYVVPK